MTAAPRLALFEHLPAQLQPIAQRALELGLKVEIHSALRGQLWLSVEAIDLQNTIGFFFVDGRLRALMNVHANADPLRLIDNARRVGDVYRQLTRDDSQAEDDAREAEEEARAESNVRRGVFAGWCP